MCLCGTDVQFSNFVSPDRYQYRLQLSTDSQFCMQLGTPISTSTTRTPFIQWLYFIYQCTGQIISFQMMPPLRSFDDVDGKERGQKKTDDLRAMTILGPRTLHSLDAEFTVLEMTTSNAFFLVSSRFCTISYMLLSCQRIGRDYLFLRWWRVVSSASV